MLKGSDPLMPTTIEQIQDMDFEFGPGILSCSLPQSNCDDNFDQLQQKENFDEEQEINIPIFNNSHYWYPVFKLKK